MELFELGIKGLIENRPNLIKNYNGQYGHNELTYTNWLRNIYDQKILIDDSMIGVELVSPGYAQGYFQALDLEANTQYTLQAYIKTTGAVRGIVRVTSADGTLLDKTNLNDGLYKFSFTTGSTAGEVRVLVVTSTGNSGDTLKFIAQLEKGTVGTPLYPALYDEPGDIYDYLKVELDNKTSVNLKKYFEDISNPSKIKNNISTTTYIPATTNNNQIFDHIWHLSNDVYSFDPTVRNDYILTKSGVVVDFGYIKLNKVVYTNQVPRNYDITLYGKKFDFLFNLSDKYLDELNVGNDFNHTINRQAVLNTWNPAMPQSEIYKYILSYSGQYDNFDSKKIFSEFESRARNPAFSIIYDTSRNIWVAVSSDAIIFINPNTFTVEVVEFNSFENPMTNPRTIYFDSKTNNYLFVNESTQIGYVTGPDDRQMKYIGMPSNVCDISMMKTTWSDASPDNWNGFYAVYTINGLMNYYSDIYSGGGYYSIDISDAIGTAVGTRARYLRVRGNYVNIGGTNYYTSDGIFYDGNILVYKTQERITPNPTLPFAVLTFSSNPIQVTPTLVRNNIATADINPTPNGIVNRFVAVSQNAVYHIATTADVDASWTTVPKTAAGITGVINGISQSKTGELFIYSTTSELSKMILQPAGYNPTFDIIPNNIDNSSLQYISWNKDDSDPLYVASIIDSSNHNSIAYTKDQGTTWDFATGYTYDDYEDDDIDEHVREEYRSYYQRPAVRLKYLIQKILDDSGYEYMLYPEFFNDNNPYWHKTWVIHSRLKSLEELPDNHNGNVRTGDSVTYPQMIRRDVTQFKFLTDYLKMFGLIVTIDNPDNVVRIMTRNEFFNTNPVFIENNPEWNYIVNSNGQYGFSNGNYDNWSSHNAIPLNASSRYIEFDAEVGASEAGLFQNLTLQKGVEYTINIQIPITITGLIPEIYIENTVSGTIHFPLTSGGVHSTTFTSLGGSTTIGVQYPNYIEEEHTLSFRIWLNKGTESKTYTPQEEQTSAPIEVPGVTINEITVDVDYSKEFSFEPVPYDYKYAVLQYDAAGTHYEDSYYNEFNSQYGYLRLNTGYEFNVNENDWFNGLLFTNAVMSTEVDKYFQGRAGTVELYRDNKILPALFTLSNTRRSYNDSSMHLVFIDGMQEVTTPMRLSDDAPDMLKQSLFMWADHTSYYTEFTQFPNVCKVTADSKASLDFARPAKLYYNGEYPDRIGIYDNFFSYYIEEFHNKNNKLVTCSVDWNYIDMASWSFANFWKINSNLFHCISAGPYNLADDRTTQAEMIRVRDINNYLNGQTIPVSQPTNEVVIKNGVLPEPGTGGNIDYYYWECRVCEYEYHADEHGGIDFRDQPSSYVCPVCGASKSQFGTVQV